MKNNSILTSREFVDTGWKRVIDEINLGYEIFEIDNYTAYHSKNYDDYRNVLIRDDEGRGADIFNGNIKSYDELVTVMQMLGIIERFEYDETLLVEDQNVDMSHLNDIVETIGNNLPGTIEFKEAIVSFSLDLIHDSNLQNQVMNVKFTGGLSQEQIAELDRRVKKYQKGANSELLK